MATFETSAMVGAQGEVHVSGVPFAVGTPVEVAIRVKTSVGNGSPEVDSQRLDAARARMQELFASVTGFRGASQLRREDLYDR